VRPSPALCDRTHRGVGESLGLVTVASAALREVRPQVLVLGRSTPVVAVQVGRRPVGGVARLVDVPGTVRREMRRMSRRTPDNSVVAHYVIAVQPAAVVMRTHPPGSWHSYY